MKYKLNRSKNTKRNIIFGLIHRIIGLVLPFFCQTVLIYVLGAEYNGLKGLFSSILTILNLAELGFGSALVFAMYEPITKDDKITICALLNLYKKVYRIIGISIFAIGLCATPFLPWFIHGKVPSDINLQAIYLLYLINTSISYLMFAYKSSLLSAFQRVDIINITGITTTIFLNVCQILVLLKTKDYYLYLVVSIISSILNNLIISLCVDRMYPE